MTIQTTTQVIEQKLIEYFSSQNQLHIDSSQIKQHYLNNRVKGLSFKTNLFEKDEHLEMFISKLIFIIECSIYADIEKNSFDSFVIQSKDTFLFIKKQINIKNIPYFEEYLRTQQLPMIDKSEHCDEFPSIYFAATKTTKVTYD